jgi:hypothetical protein
MKQDRQKQQVSDFQPDTLGELPMTIAGYGFWGGMITLVLSIAVTIYLMTVAGGDASKAPTIANSISLFSKGIMIGVVAMVISSAWLYWEEEIMVAVNVIIALALFFSPAWLPSVLSVQTNVGVDAGYQSLANGGKLYLGFALAILVADIALRIRARMVHGTKADLLKYGKNVKEEVEKQNILMGKCWQLPYCRKFVREKCPIFHAKVTCWRELVGCMCEEAVIRTAMENKPVSKEALLSGAAIPRNNKLTVSQKRDRCKNCVIYNEHQKHKYKVAMPAVVIGYALVYILLKAPIADMINGLLGGASNAVRGLTAGAIKEVNTGDYFTQFLVGAFVLVMMAYTIKLVEYALFKLKI